MFFLCAGSNDRGSRKRKPSKGSESGGTKNDTPEISVQAVSVVQTDFSADNLQKSVCFTPDSTKLLTGGADGYVRVWEFPAMKKLYDFKAHGGEIEDITVSPANKVTTGPARVLGSGESSRHPMCDRPFLPPYALYIPEVPPNTDQRALPVVVTRGGDESDILLSPTQRLYYVQEAHGIVVTDLAFFPDTQSGRALRGENETAMLSVAVDSRCKLHVVPNRRTFPVWLLLLFCAVLLVAVILLLQFFFPDFF
ncbi:guanine nucleotide-exchange factor SEC12 [Pyxicephalus adspersus]|uniref:guanine nucleotide-exchange factor SEC12 n=1 Tax=Pyxicephalus adspersus TaxID=30357 RepID=UPI003B5C7C6C